MAILQLKLVCFPLVSTTSFPMYEYEKEEWGQTEARALQIFRPAAPPCIDQGDVRESWLALPSHEPDWVPAREHKLQVLCDRSQTTFDGCNDNLVKIYYYALHKSVVLPFVEHRWKIFIYGSIKIKKHGNDSSLYMHCVNEGGRRIDHRRGRNNIDLL